VIQQKTFGDVLIYPNSVGFFGVFFPVSSDSNMVTVSANGDLGNGVEVHIPLYLGQLHEHPSLNTWRNRLDPRQHVRFVCTQVLIANC